VRLRRLLETQPLPGAHEAEERSWAVVNAAFAERQPVRRRRRAWRYAAIAVAIGAVGAAAASSAGRSLVHDAFVRGGDRHAEITLRSLPTPGSLLVNAPGGAWIVHADGTRRRLGSYRDATWSPHGRFVAAARGDQLFALEPDGTVRWSLARRAPVRLPSWSPEGRIRGDTRIAYLAGRSLHVVGGDSRGDHVLARAVAPVQPAWRPHAEHVVAFAAPDGRVEVDAADGARRLWRTPLLGTVRRLSWSTDGRLLLVQLPRGLRIYSAAGRPRGRLLGRGTAPVLASAFVPGRHAVTVVQRSPLTNINDVWLFDGETVRRLFSGPGEIDQLAWSPNARWLLLSWSSADQWRFFEPAAPRRHFAVGRIGTAFSSGRRTTPTLAGWCCSPGAG
jgi:hypothetical protein